MLIPISAQNLTLPISVTSTASTSVALPAKGGTVRFIVEGSAMVFVSIGTGTQTATLPNATSTRTSTPILPGSDTSLSIPPDDIWNISAITRSGTATLHVQVGEGV